MELSIGEKILYRKEDKLYEGVIKSIKGEKVEIDDKTIKLIIVAISKNTIADNLIFREKQNCSISNIKTSIPEEMWETKRGKKATKKADEIVKSISDFQKKRVTK